MIKRVTTCGLAVLLGCGLAAPVAAKPPDIGVLRPEESLGDNLRRLSADGKRVEVVLKNGKSYRGVLRGVSDRAVVVGEIEGREFFDALVLIEEIAAVEVRVRDR